MLSDDFKNATIEAIYWWNRTENYYHKYFSKFDKIYKDKELLDFFVEKLFNVFLIEYSVRRNINSGKDSVNKFLEELMSYDFINRIKLGDIEAIDDISDKLLKSKISVDNHTISLLSKIAFLVNPIEFSISDSLAKKSLWHLTIGKHNYLKYNLNNYSIFYKLVNNLLIEFEEILHEQQKTLKLFEGTEASIFYSKNLIAFNRRILDKFFWLKAQKESGSRIIFNNEPYLDFLKM